MTTSNQSAVDALSAFRAAPKFRCTEPQFRILNPSPLSVTAPMVAALNECAAQLISLVQAQSSSSQMRAAIARSLHSVEKPFDTEDREYLAYYYNELGVIVGIKTGPILNRWLYGFPLSLLLRLFGRG